MFTFPVDVEDLFTERAAQIAAWGIPRRTVRRVRGRIREMWSDGPGGWVHEWSAEAARAERRRDWLLAAALHGAARFPTACTPSRREALRRQVECYLAAAHRFPVPFERRVVDGIPTHLFSPRRAPHAPIVLLSGGVDTYKMELHRLALALARGGLRVAAIDMPGTGETGGTLAPDSDQVYARVLDAVAGGAPRGVIGLSFGGHWAAKLALRGVVDAAVDVGGPVGAVDVDAGSILRLPNGMPGIIANALGLGALPTLDEVARLLAAFSLRRQGLLTAAQLRVPLLVVNGAADAYVPVEDTTVFRDFPNAEVVLVRDADHCAADRFLRVAPSFVAWMRMRLLATTGSRALHRVARLLLPPQATIATS